MSRRQDRIHALKLIFQIEFFDDLDPEATMNLYFESFANIEESDENNSSDNKADNKTDNKTDIEIDKAFVRDEFIGTIKNKDIIDGIIGENIKKWDVSRLSKTDLAILRLAVYEIMYMDNIPNGASIFEAVEIAKIFSSDTSPSFINGILGEISDKKRHGKSND